MTASEPNKAGFRGIISWRAAPNAGLIAFLAMAGPVFGQESISMGGVWWTDRVDSDGDGYWEGTNGDYARLHCNPDVVGGPGSLEVSIYFRAFPCGKHDWHDVVWNRVRRDYVITGTVFDDVYMDVPMGSGGRCFDYEIRSYPKTSLSSRRVHPR